MSEKLRIFMSVIDDDLLEEAKTPQKSKNIRPWLGIAAAACLLMVVALPMFRNSENMITLTTLSDMGYDMTLPDTAENIRYGVVTLTNRDGAQACFSIKETEYVYQAVKTEEPQSLVGGSDAGVQHLSWNADDLDIRLMSSSDSTSVSWYTQENQTQWYLTASADSLEVLTTASQILRTTGLDVAVAPADAAAITYNAFPYEDLTVAETCFVLDGVAYSYRMAATVDLLENFKDLSGLECPFESVAAGDVSWCRAKISFNEGAQGKIIWFDVVPGILYSLTMDNGASKEALLHVANELFEPAQDNS